MITAFQPNAFQNDAFQVEVEARLPFSVPFWAGRMERHKKRILEDDREMLKIIKLFLGEL